MSLAPLLVDGGFAATEDDLAGFYAVNPETGIPITGDYPTSGPRDLEKLIAGGSLCAHRNSPSWIPNRSPVSSKPMPGALNHVG